MGRVYTALVKSGQWSDHPGTVARPIVKKSSETEVSEPNASRPRKYPAPVLVPEAPKRVERIVRAQSVEFSIEPQDERRPEAETLVIEPVTSNVSRLARLVRKPEPERSSGVPEADGHYSESKEALTKDCPVVRVSALSLDPHLTALGQQGSLAAERFQTLAVRIFNLAQKRGIKSLLITSALEGEGKTTVATGLAALMARPSDRKVLLVDSDLRRPSAARTLGVSSGVSLQIGWRDVLEGKASALQSLVRLEPMGLYLLAGSSRTSSPRNVLPPTSARDVADQLAAGDLFASSRPEEVIRELERQFSLVVIDAPAILDFAESQRLASIADATLIVTREGETQSRAVCDAVKLVPKDRRLGVVLNESSIDREPANDGAGRKRWFLGFFKNRRRS
jgi:protein-tyrosine kinase